MALIKYSGRGSGDRFWIIEEHDSLDLVFTLFNQEILACEWVRLCPGFEKGYPQPDHSLAKWRQVTFSWTCPSCGLVAGQKAPLRIRKELGMGRNDFVSLYWTYSILCIRRVVNKIQEADLRGVEIWPVHGKGIPSEVLSQLVFPVVAGPGLDPRDERRPETCPDCGTTKYSYHSRGYMHIRRQS